MIFSPSPKSPPVSSVPVTIPDKGIDYKHIPESFLQTFHAFNPWVIIDTVYHIAQFHIIRRFLIYIRKQK